MLVVHVEIRGQMSPYKRSSFAILDAIFLKPIEVPDILLNLTPFSDSRGNLHT